MVQLIAFPSKHTYGILENEHSSLFNSILIRIVWC